MDKKQNLKQAFFAGGCFWRVEHMFKHKHGVISTSSGYMGGSLDNPTYKDVCHKDTGHMETVKLMYDPLEISYEELAKFFFEMHDPTQVNGQGLDFGSQYASAVFYEDEKEKTIINKLITILQDKGHKIVTKLIRAEKFWKAEDYHQNYYGKRQVNHE